MDLIPIISRWPKVFISGFVRNVANNSVDSHMVPLILFFLIFFEGVPRYNCKTCSIIYCERCVFGERGLAPLCVNFNIAGCIAESCKFAHLKSPEYRNVCIPFQTPQGWKFKLINEPGCSQRWCPNSHIPVQYGRPETQGFLNWWLSLILVSQITAATPTAWRILWKKEIGRPPW